MKTLIDRRTFLAASSAFLAELSLPYKVLAAQTKKISPWIHPGGIIKVGFLWSLKGGLSTIETPSRDVGLYWADEVNKNGGVAGCKIEPVVFDAESDMKTYRTGIKKLMHEDKVLAVFGGFTSASRRSVMPLVTLANHLFYYPTVYEGRECWQNLICTGALANQHSYDLIPYMVKHFGPRGYFIGSNYVWPKESNCNAHHWLKNAQGEMCHLILKSRKIPDKEEWHVLSFDDVTELNLMQFFDKKATTNDELIHDKKTIMSFIKIVKENCTELKIHNFYKGLTIVNKGVVVDLTEDAVTLKTEIAQLRIVNLTKFMTISSEIFPKCIVCRSIKKIDFDEQKLVIEDMVFTSRSAVDRKYIRLEPEVNHTCALFYNDVEVPTEMKIADVSEVSAKVEVDILPPGIDINKTVKLTMKFTLHSKPLTIITEASVYRIDENKNSFFVVVLFEL